uniref:Uncharacterized protein n=1 Tax=Mus musculus TaxID=10090 RepID=Q9D3Y5_MOUSE|nr:unnamed protein product [Mus musculus]
MVKESNDCHPAGCDKPPDSPAGGPGFGAAALDALWVPGPWCPWRLFPRAMRPLHGDELRDDLCLLSGAEGSAMLCPGGGSRSSSAATAAAWSEGCWAETQRRRRRAPEERRLGAAMTFPRPPSREEHKRGGAPWSPGGAQATFDSAPSPNRNWPLRLSQSDRSVKGRGRNGGVRQ